ncbi:MAG TPA: hypothetical protein VL738_22040 [Dactylosporangium sp.]|jgi:hypothetical protein|nr:hypothetical protein [Dactylosporangium sp.]
MTGNPQALHLERPLEISEARTAARRMAEQRREAENALQAQVERAAETEREYRKAFSAAFVAAEGTAAAREAEAKAASADECYARDLAAGMVKVATERLRGLEGERSMLKSLTDWSSRLRLDELEHVGGETFGRRAA